MKNSHLSRATFAIARGQEATVSVTCCKFPGLDFLQNQKTQLNGCSTAHGVTPLSEGGRS
jgi:hypothetical protein